MKSATRLSGDDSPRLARPNGTGKTEIIMKTKTTTKKTLEKKILDKTAGADEPRSRFRPLPVRGLALGPRDKALIVGGALGALAGVGAVYLPPHLRLSHRPTERTRLTGTFTIALYTGGGLAAGLTYQTLPL